MKFVNLFFFGILFFLFWDAFLVFDRKPLLYSLSESATNRNSEEQLSANYTSPYPQKTKTKKNAQGKFHFSKATCCSTRASNFTLNNVFSIPALLFPITNKTGVVFHFKLKSSKKGMKWEYKWEYNINEWQYKWEYLYIVFHRSKAVDIFVCHRCVIWNNCIS